MNLRARLSVLCLEARDNPSGPELIDPYSVPTAPTTDTTTATTDTTTTTTTTTSTTTTTTDPLLDTNSIYKVPLLESSIYVLPL